MLKGEANERDRPVIPAGTSVLVSGAGGFIGTHLCDRLLACGADICAVSRTFKYESHGLLRKVPIDLSDPAATRKVIEMNKPDIIFHLAGLAAGARDAALVLPTFSSNLASTVNVLTAALERGTPRVVLPGSLEEPVIPGATASSPYAMSKWAASEYGRMFHSLYDLPVAIARIFITYGPTSKDLHKLIPHVLLALLAHESPKLASGLREVDWVHVDDVVDGLFTLATAPAAVGATLDIGSGRLASIRSIVERLSALVGSDAEPRFGALPDRPFEQIHVADVTRTFQHVGWRPRVDLDAGLASTVEWFRRNHRQLRSV